MADGRVKLKKDNLAWVYSSSGRKHYDVQFDLINNAISANDNGSYWQGYLGYPAIAVLFDKKVLPFDADLAEALINIKWKDINEKFGKNHERTEKYILDLLAERGFSKEEVKIVTDGILNRIIELGLLRLGPLKKPPLGY